MEDIVQPILVILVGGLFAPLLTQLIEKIIANPEAIKDEQKGKNAKRKRWFKLFFYAVIIQLVLFTIFFFCSKWIYFDKNYFPTSERELIREGIKKDKQYVIPKMTIRIYSESNTGVRLPDSLCMGKKISYCCLISISYEIVALRDFNGEKIFTEYYEGLYAAKVLKEPGSEVEGDDKDPNDTYCKYDIVTTMKKFERRTITTRADLLYGDFPPKREFVDKEYSGANWDFFGYPNQEDDVIGEVEYQIISRSLKMNTPQVSDAIYKDEKDKQIPILPQLTVSNGNCMEYNIITAKIPRLKNNESFSIKWNWR